MPLLIVAFTLFVILAAIALTPLALVQRYRLGTARRRARGWSATVNVAGLALSSGLFLAGAGITSLWVPNALTLTLMGFVSWHAWHAASDYGSWAAESGAAGSLAAGAVVLGYYLTYWLGVRRRLQWHARPLGRT